MMQVQEMTKIRGLETTDAALARQALGGDNAAFERLVQRYTTPLLSFIYRFLGDHDLALDVLQHVFIQLYTLLPTLRTDKPLKSWLFQVAHNRCLDEVRRKRAIPFSQLEQGSDDDEISLLTAIPDSRPLPEEMAERSDLRRSVLQAIDTLPPKYRSVVMLRYTRELSFMEIGQTLHMPEATAKTYFQRAKVQLRGVLQQRKTALLG
ncbi:MAG TPA: sigma-70 family RNA polymerase sigma factor [Ktedonobacteraceae bacterium]|nr:sigma-70 family RNA polymerase sigma factor [Ktedonobacteraceae bacterium]